MTKEDTVSSERIYEGRVINLRIDSVRMPDGQIRQREIVEHRGAIAIVAITRDDSVLLVRQFRSGPGRVLLEIPAGTREVGEPVEECVQRELQEETGHRAGKIRRLLGFFSSPGFCDEFLEIYVATDLSPSTLTADDDEQIAVESVPVGQLSEMMRSGEICDAKSVAGLLAYLFLENKARG
ncbi:MAG TPA: NUDIX hydrolase [Chloroflexota bacterium]|nr:NUDIX hydrolase [Chloroflexota bacterium]